MEYKGDLLYSEGGEALAQVSQRSLAVPSLAVFKARLDGALSNLVSWKVSLPKAGGLELYDIQGPFQPIPVYGSVSLENNDVRIIVVWTDRTATLWFTHEGCITRSCFWYNCVVWYLPLLQNH